MKLLNIDQNSKTVKGQKYGFLTGVMYLSPASASGRNVCAYAELAGCIKGCLNTAGRGGIAKNNALINTISGPIPDNHIQHARIQRTNLYFDNRPLFFEMLIKEIRALIRKANRLDLIPVIRLNGTSDINWTKQRYQDKTIFAWFLGIQFYDYTKNISLDYSSMPDNYHISISYSAANPEYAQLAIAAAKKYNLNLVIVFKKDFPKIFFGLPVVNGDDSDLRFLDPDNSIIGLKAKGKACSDSSGFVIDPLTHQAPQFPPIEIAA